MNPNEGLSWLGKIRLVTRVRRHLRAGIGRLRGGWWQILQTAVAAGVAWFLAVLILGHEQPLFAPIASVISLGLAVGERGRRAAELIIGVAFGFAIADLLVFVLGVGPVQIAVVVALAMAVTLFLGRGELGVNEAAISGAILSVAFQPAAGASFLPDRLFEGLIGCSVALVVNALLPINPELMVERAAHPVFDDSVAVLEEMAAALTEGDFERAERVLQRAREIDERVSGFKEALAAGRETARFAPPRRPTLSHIELYAGAADQIDLMVRNVRGLTRAAATAVRYSSPASELLAQAILDLARSVEALAMYLERAEQPEDTRELALKAAGDASALLRDHHEDLVTSELVGRIRTTAIDIIRGTGMDREEALQALEEAASRASQPD